MNIHPGVNSLIKLFTASYKVENVTALAKIVVKGCRACRLNTQSSKQNFPPGRIPLQTEPNKLWYVDHMAVSDLFVKGQKAKMLFNIMDSYSGFLASFPNKRETAQEVIDSFRKAIAMLGTPEAVVSDNHTALLKNKEVQRFLKSQGVRKVYLTCPYSSSSNRVERLHSTMRRAIKLTSETFHRNPYDIFYQVVSMINQRPLTIANHPTIKDLVGKFDKVVTPYDLQFNRQQDPPVLQKLSKTCTDEGFDSFKQKWKSLITEYNLKQEETHKKKFEHFKKKENLDIGSLVYTIRMQKPHKEKLKYYRNIYEIIEISHRKFTLRPLFGSLQTITVHGNKIKPYEFSPLLEILPKPLRLFLGENLSPE